VVPLHLPPRSHVAFRAAAVTKVFGDTIALWDVDLEGSSGELVAIHGANGSGKSTLLRIIAGLAAPTRGRVAWTTDRPGVRPRIGLLGHASHLFDELTAFENVALAARLARRDEAVAIDLLGRVGVAQFAARRTGGLSSGTRRRVGLARVLATQPDVLVVDEPFAGLDQSAADLVGRILAETRDEGRVVVIATHDDARSRSIATTTAWLEAGRLRPMAGAAMEAGAS
jgi:heme ABC exporter ATP-binding subunit CcmA